MGTGEVPFMKASQDRVFDVAKVTGARIVHACGYDSVPSDLLAWLAAQTMLERHGCPCKSLKYFAGDSKGGAPGGTIATAQYYASKGIREDSSYPLDPPDGIGGPDTT